MKAGGPRPETAVMVLSGEYDIASKDQLRAAFGSIADVARAVLDFGDVTYVDSSVIVEVVRLHNVRAAIGLPRVTMVARNAHLLKVFDICKLDVIVDIVETLDDAIGKNGDHIPIYYAYSFDGLTETECTDSVAEAAN